MCSNELAKMRHYILVSAHGRTLCIPVLMYSIGAGISCARRFPDGNRQAADLRAVGESTPVDDGGGGGDELQVVLALQPLLHDLAVQQAQEAAPEAEAHRRRHLP